MITLPHLKNEGLHKMVSAVKRLTASITYHLIKSAQSQLLFTRPAFSFFSHVQKINCELLLVSHKVDDAKNINAYFTVSINAHVNL